MKTWRYENSTWQDCPAGLPLRSPEPAWLGGQQVALPMFADNGYRLMSHYTGPGAMLVWLYEKDESNIIGPDFVAFVSLSQQDHVVLLSTLPDLMDWLARYRPCFLNTFTPAECEVTTDKEAVTEANHEL